jgi:hypothetical protein
MKGNVMNPNSTGVKLTKFATKVVVGFGASKIASDIIKNNVRTPVTKIDKITITAASFVIGMMVTEATDNFVIGQIDSLIEQVNSLKQTKTEDTPAS